MIFERVALTNLFTYEGTQVFELAPPHDGRNIAIIEGRNNFGKTSFLNSIKLLYSGITDELLENVQRKRKPSLNKYVVGDGENWWGLLNRRARMNGASRAAVSIQWREGIHSIKAERSWEIYGSHYSENLEITGSILTEPLHNQEAARFLDQRLPAAYVPFFFFDGEQIQRIAEANPQEQISQIERFLDIAPLDELRNTLGKAITEWQKEGASAEEKAELNHIEHEINKRRDHLTICEQKRGDLIAERDDLASDISTLERKIESAHSVIHRNDKKRLEHEREQLGEQQEALRREVLTIFAREAPLFASRTLLERVLNELRPSLRTSNGDNELLNLCMQLETDLPDTVFNQKPDSRPPLSPEQRVFYQKRLIDRLREYRPTNNNPPTLMSWRLDIPRAQSIFEQMNAILGRPTEAQTHANRLRSLQTISAKLDQLTDELANVEQMDVREREVYEANKINHKHKTDRHTDILANIISLEKDVNRLSTEISALEKKHDAQREQLARSEAARAHIDRARAMQNLFLKYKETLKRRHRAKLEGAINRNLIALMDSTKLIHRIVVDEDFSLHYQDTADQPVPNASISAGTKQIIATALLWGLKECASKQLPVVIDTPLGRIDRGNQERLLTCYYPRVSSQVILLPTDSELDASKLDLLRPFVYRHYRLDNAAGDHVSLIDTTAKTIS